MHPLHAAKSLAAVAGCCADLPTAGAHQAVAAAAANVETLAAAVAVESM